MAPAETATLQLAKALGAHLIVAGKQVRSTLASLILGSVSNRVLAGSHCDTLLVPATRNGSRPRLLEVQSHKLQAEAKPGSAGSAAEPVSQSRLADRTP